MPREKKPPRGLRLRPILFRETVPELYAYFLGKYGREMADERSIACDKQDKEAVRVGLARAQERAQDKERGTNE